MESNTFTSFPTFAQNPMMASNGSPHRKTPRQDDLAVKAPTIFVVDPDSTTDKIVREVVDGYQLDVQTHTTGRSFFAAYDGKQPGCLVLELRISDASGIQIQRTLAEQNQRLPIVFVTSSIDVSTAVALMREGAVHVLEKPLRAIDLLNAVQEALSLVPGRLPTST
jgi:FixJ family two-component response regulator